MENYLKTEEYKQVKRNFYLKKKLINNVFVFNSSKFVVAMIKYVKYAQLLFRIDVASLLCCRIFACVFAKTNTLENFSGQKFPWKIIHENILMQMTYIILINSQFYFFDILIFSKVIKDNAICSVHCSRKSVQYRK